MLFRASALPPRRGKGEDHAGVCGPFVAPDAGFPKQLDPAMSGESAKDFGLPAPGSPFAKEYREVILGMQRCARSAAKFDPRAYDARAIEQARVLWKARMTSEYRSTAVFSAIAGQLIEANAPMDATAVALRLAQDEVRHADLCGETLIALGAEPVAPAPVDLQPLARHKGATAEERVLRNVIYGCCLSETVNTSRFVDALDTMTDPFMRDITRVLMSDEVVHAQFGFMYLDMQKEWLERHPEVRVSLAAYLRYAFGVLERLMSGRGAPLRETTSDGLALGVTDPARLPDTFYQTMTGAIIPGLERYGIDASTAWRERIPARGL